MPRLSGLPRRRPTSGWADLVALVERLRSKTGCPWDRAQTHVSLIKYLREESAEVEKALRRGKWDEIEDELGDLLLQVLLHAEIAREKALKLHRRHPHVFGGGKKYADADAVLADWKTVKGYERALRARDVKARRRARRA
jgi:uncharacterized protein YabN with tetrapyrrole methylase and pyrophosphatase domain